MTEPNWKEVKPKEVAHLQRRHWTKETEIISGLYNAGYLKASSFVGSGMIGTPVKIPSPKMGIVFTEAMKSKLNELLGLPKKSGAQIFKNYLERRKAK